MGSYHGTAAVPELPAVLEYPLYAEINRVFAGGQPTSYLTYRLARLMDPSLYPNPFATPTFIDNHDNQRFLSVGTRTGLAQALCFLFTIPGIPIVYYGTEQSFTETRAAMFEGGWKSNGDSFLVGDPYVRIQKLAELRKASKAFTHGTLDVLYDNAAGPGPFAYRRVLAGDTMLVLLNTSDRRALVSGLDVQLAPGTVLEVLHSEQKPLTPLVNATGKIDLALPGRAVLILRATPQIITPSPPGASIDVTTPVDGQTFSSNVTVEGTVSPAGTVVKMVLDDALEGAPDVPVAPDGSFSVVLPVSDFPIGTADHTLAFYAPAENVSTPRLRFTSDVVFNGTTITVDDPPGDDKGPSGTYLYPQDSTFGHQMDITHVTAEVGATTMYLHVTMAEWSTVWKPANGFDHVAFNIYFAVPGSPGLTVLPKLNAAAPPGFSWALNQFTYGWNNVMYTSQGATATTYGSTAIAPKLRADMATKTVTFTYNRNDYGIASWAGVEVYVATWDFDGIGGNFRLLTPTGGQWDFGGGATTDPMIMDDVPPITLPPPP